MVVNWTALNLDNYSGQDLDNYSGQDLDNYSGQDLDNYSGQDARTTRFRVGYKGHLILTNPAFSISS
jgi:hypothetical protein